jgi:hypothetical protein
MVSTSVNWTSCTASRIDTERAMYLLGYSIDNISLLGLTLAVGLVVDDAIVMLASTMVSTSVNWTSCTASRIDTERSLTTSMVPLAPSCSRLAATLIPSVAVPISIIATFGAMYLLGYSIDNISLSCTASRIDTERSLTTSMVPLAPSCSWNFGSIARTWP